MQNHDLVQRALRLLAQQAKARARQPQKSDPARTVHAGDRITWERADGSIHTAVVDFLHAAADGSLWGFVTLGKDWAAVNLKFATVRTDADGGEPRYPPMSPDLVA